MVRHFDNEQQERWNRLKLVGRVERETLPLVFAELIRCPRCAAPHPKIVKTIDQGDSELRYATCRSCDQHFKICSE